MLYAAINIHKRMFQAAVLDVDTGETVERRFGATREELNDWAMPLQGELAAVAIEATNGYEGWPCQRARLLTVEDRRWVTSLSLSPAARAQVDRLLRLIEAVEGELRALETELRRFARGDRRCLALQTIYGVGPILACHLLAELGEAARFRRA